MEIPSFDCIESKRLWAFVDDVAGEQIENESVEVTRRVEQRDQAMAILVMSITVLPRHNGGALE